MSDAVQIELIKSLAPLVLGAITAFFAYKASNNSQRAVTIAKQTEENTNHLKDELVAAVKEVAYNLGHAEGVKDQKKEG